TKGGGDKWEKYAEKPTSPAAASVKPPTAESPTFLNTLEREGKAAGGAIVGIPGAVYHAAADPETAEESRRFGKDFEKKIGPTGRGTDRRAVQPAINALSDYGLLPEALGGRGVGRSHVAPTITVDNALGVLPEAIGGAGGAMVGAKAIESAANA